MDSLNVADMYIPVLIVIAQLSGEVDTTAGLTTSICAKEEANDNRASNSEKKRFLFRRVDFFVIASQVVDE